MRACFLPLWTALLVVLPASSVAQTPADFRRPAVYVQPNLNVRHFSGTLGDLSSWSLGVGVTQGVQVGYLGGYVTLDTDFFLSSQSPPPLNSGFQISGFGLGGRFQYPFGDFRTFAELGYRRVGFVSNALIVETGGSLSYHALDMAAGVRLVQLSPFYVELATSLAWLPSLEDSLLFGLTLALGVRTIL